MKAILFISHGSRNKSSNKEIEIFFKKLYPKINHIFQKGEVAFLEFGSPNIEETLERLCIINPSSIVIFPYFLMNGVHVQKDIPEIIESFKKRFNKINFSILPAITGLKNIDDFIADSILDAVA